MKKKFLLYAGSVMCLSLSVVEISNAMQNEDGFSPRNMADTFNGRQNTIPDYTSLLSKIENHNVYGVDYVGCYVNKSPASDGNMIRWASIKDCCGAQYFMITEDAYQKFKARKDKPIPKPRPKP